MVVVWNLAQIITKVRQLTSTPTQEQLSDATITDYINTYYVYTMPFELKEQINLQPYNFTTTANTDTYAVSGAFQTDEPMAYANGYPLVFYQDRDVFYQDWPQQYTQDQVASASGATATFAGTTQASPIIKGTYFITDGTQVAFDKSDGILYQTIATVDTAVGTINYLTGAFSVTFNSIPVAGTLVYDNYQAYQPARPQGILFYNNQFTFRPIPDQVYQITMQGFITQIPLGDATSNPPNQVLPLQTEWGQLIAYGAALDIFMDRSDIGAYNNTFPVFKRFENVALGRFVEQFENAQSVPRF